MPGPSVVHDPAREEAELREHLGPDFDLEALRGSDALLEREFRRVGDEASFYRRSRTYLYNLTAFAMTTTKLPYLQALTSRLRPGARVLEYGCGIGSDGLMLLEAGYRVEFADFDNPSTSYLRERLRGRGLRAPVHDLDGDVPAGFDAAFAFDVLEHVPDPGHTLRELERRANLVAVNLLAAQEGDQELHHQLDIGTLLERIGGFRLRHYALHHGRSHLALYAPRPSGPVGRFANRLRIRIGRARGGSL